MGKIKYKKNKHLNKSTPDFDMVERQKKKIINKLKREVKKLEFKNMDQESQIYKMRIQLYFLDKNV